MATDIDALNLLRGFQWSVSVTSGGGLTVQSNHQLFAAEPAFGEAHRHEIVHYVLAATPNTNNGNNLIAEGIATWLGGTLGLQGPALRAQYAMYVKSHPDVTLDRVIDRDDVDWGRRPAAAILRRMVSDARGNSALRELLRTGPSSAERRNTMSRVLAKQWSSIARDWRILADAGTW